MSDRTGKSEKTRLRILEAAAAMFGDQGYSATTLRQVAKQAKIDASSVYYHFDSKEEILDEVLRIGIRAVFDAVKQAVGNLPDTATHRERIEAAVEAHLNTLLKYSVYTSANIAIFGQLPAKAKTRNRRLRQSYAEYWSAMLIAAQGAGEIDDSVDLSLLRLFLLGSVNWSLQWYDPKKKSIEEIAQAFCAMLFEGVGETQLSTLQNTG